MNCFAANLIAVILFAQPSLPASSSSVHIEAAGFVSQEHTGLRQWVKQTHPDGRVSVKCLPDTRKSHSDKLIHGENFSNEPGKVAVLNYRVDFPAPGRYFVWVRAYSTNTEDNGIHVGLDGAWPESGKRMQWCEGKRTWRWESRQRTEAEHCGVPGKIWLDVKEAGPHTVSFSMREDGFEFDRALLTTDPAIRPE